LLVLFVADLTLRPGGVHLTRTIDDVAEMVAAALAAAGGCWRAVRATGRQRASWGLLAAGCAGWAIGEAIWCYYELLAGRDTPFPSLADAGFLVFPVLALIGLLVRPSAAFSGQGRIRVSLDALLVSASLFVISWITALGEVYRAGADTWFGAVVSLAYPVSDIVLLTVTVIVIAYARTGDRIGLVTIVTGLIFLSIGDSGFAYLTAIDHYGAVNLIDAGWVGGFLIIAVAAVLDDTRDEAHAMPMAPRSALLLPYAPAAAAIAAVLHDVANGSLDGVAGVAATILVAALVGRQMLVLLDNRTLMGRIRHQAFHDVLTGLANRALFGDRLAHALELHRRDLRPVTVLLLDLDDFKNVNDSLGHPAGDELLVRVSERLLATVRTGDTVARLGGDEFALLMEDGGEPLDTATRLLLSLDHPVAIAGRLVTVRASIGVATLLPDDKPVSATEMLKRADVAMYAAKRAGKATIVRYSAALAGGDSEQLDMHSALAADIAAGAISAAYQPIHLADGTLRGFEALARWSYEGEPVSPAVFLPAAARAGLLATLDEVVMTQAVKEAAGWGDDIVLSVNLAGETLSNPAFASRVDAILSAAGVPARRLSVEMLETSAIERDDVALTTVRALRGLGVRVTVDDFGAGYASLARLRALEPDVIKVDRSLLAAEDDPTQASPLLAGITDLAHRLGASVVAEGVETETQLAAALAAGCDAVQGFLWGRPTSPEGAQELLDRARVRVSP
jgi:diguanylate cyclase (GGDEF)-like protein